MRLLIVSHVVHYHDAGGYHAYSPYAREIEMWADLFDQVVIAAPCRDGAAPPHACLIDRPNLRVAEQLEVGGVSWREKARALGAVPALFAGLSREMWKADAIHVRCPGNLGLLGALLAPLFSQRLIAKYAGQWNGFPGEEWTVRLQRRILGSRWWRGPVTVYGRAESDAPHVVDFFSSMFTAEQIARARRNVSAKRAGRPLTVAFTGRLSKAKNVDVLLRSLSVLKSEGASFKGLIIGDGAEANSLRKLADDLAIAEEVEFTGAVSPDRIPDLLERADVFVLASHSEGWPKSIAEAMAFGLVCIGSDFGLIRKFLADGRGFTVAPGDVVALTGVLRQIVSAPEQYDSMRVRASEWAQGYSLEALRESLRQLMKKSWKLPEGCSLQRSEAAEIQ
jgi:glycosyltransferase involved in cell wall biosynthesis